MRVTEVAQLIDAALPPSSAMLGDPVGLQVMSDDVDVRSIAIAYELSEDVVAQAKQKDCQLIVAFHPLIFNPLSSIRSDAGRVSRTVVALIKSEIALHIVHTAFDAHPRGTSVLLAEALQLNNIRPLVAGEADGSFGMGAVGDLEFAVSFPELIDRVKTACGATFVRTSLARNDAMMKTIGVLGGSGMSFYSDAVSARVDAFVTADIRYHDFHRAAVSVAVIDAGHAETERFVVNGLLDVVTDAVRKVSPRIQVVELSQATNPVRYV